jgi:hypothetical protein
MANPSAPLNSVMAHRVTFESPDTVCISLIGPLTATEGEAIIARIHELGREHGPMFWLIDVCRFAASGERVRNVFLKGAAERYPIFAGVMCGAPFPVRVAMMMVLTAGARVMPKSFSFPFEFTATNAEAREWIAMQRDAMTTHADSGALFATGG